MLGDWVWNETAPSSASSAASVNAVQQADPNSPSGTLSSSMVDEFEMLTIIGEFAGNAGGTLDVYVQTFINGHWYDMCHIKQQAAAASVQRIQYVAGRATQTNGTLIGIDGSPALANDTIVGGVWGEKFRLWMVSGTSTSSGASVKVTMAGQIMRNAKR